MTDLGQAPEPQQGPRPPPGKGRVKGTVLKTTQLTRVHIRTAVQILRNGEGENPIEAAQKIARFLEGLSKRRMDEIIARVTTLSGEEFDRVVNTLYKSANIQLRLADYVFPKPGRIDLPAQLDGKGPPKTREELVKELQERGLPAWVFGEDGPVIDQKANGGEAT